MKRILLGVSLLALSATAAWAQGTTTGPTYGQPAVAPPPAPPTAAPPTGQPMGPTTRPTYGQPSTQASTPKGDVPPYTAEVGPRQGDWEAFIGGSGTSDDEFKRNALSVSGSIGYYVLKFLPISLHQSFGAVFGGHVNDNFQYSTTGAVDLQAPLGRFQPFIGGFGGYAYGANYSWVTGPEAGLKFYVNESTFIQGLFQYGLIADKNFQWNDGVAVYTIGAGFNF
jgi:hypothetical protein